MTAGLPPVAVIQVGYLVNVQNRWAEAYFAQRAAPNLPAEGRRTRRVTLSRYIDKGRLGTADMPQRYRRSLLGELACE